MSFDIKRFVTNPLKTELFAFTKPQLKQVVNKLELDCEISTKKIELRTLVLDYFVKEDLIAEQQLSDTSNNEVEIKHLELEHRVREQERDHDCQVWLVPPFQEQEVDKFFLHFKKVAANLYWPAEAKTMLLQSVLVGKAREAYSSLSVEQSLDYEFVKGEILKAYELVTEAYRLKFQKMKCKEGQTFLEFSYQKEALFNRWCTSQQIGNSFEKLKQLILLESCVPVNIKAYLEEQKVEELHRAAILADNYKLTHQSFSSASGCKDAVSSKPKGIFNSANSDASGRAPNQSQEQEQIDQSKRNGVKIRTSLCIL